MVMCSVIDGYSLLLNIRFGMLKWIVLFCLGFMVMWFRVVVVCVSFLIGGMVCCGFNGVLGLFGLFLMWV